MVNIEAVRRLLAIAEVNKDPYAVAEVAGALLAGNRADVPALAAYARALGALGLLAAAQRVIGESGNKVSTVNAGVVAWKSRARRFAANLAALASRDPAGAALVEEAAKNLDRFELHTASDGNFQVLDTTKEMPAAWLGGLTMHKAAEGLWKYDRTQQPVLGPVAFEGLGFGWLFMKVLATTERTYLDYSCAIYVLEGDPVGLAMLFHMHDLQENIRQERVRWFIAATPEEAGAAFRRAVEANSSWSLPEQFIRCGLRGQASTGAEGMIRELMESRAQRRERLVSQARALYAGRDAAYWRNRYEEAASGRGERLRILGITSRYTTVLKYSMAELCEAAKDAGHDMRVAMEPDDTSVENPYDEMIATFKPDLIVQISRMRYENPALPANVPFLCWDQDNLPCMRTPGATASLDALTYVAGHGALYGFAHLGWPRENVLFSHPAGATFRYSAEPAPAPLRDKHACDISFVSNAADTPESLIPTLATRWSDDALVRVFRTAADQILAGTDAGECWDFFTLDQLANQTADTLGLVPNAVGRREITMALVALADRCYRHAALHWIRRWAENGNRTFRIYGRGWDRHPAFSKYAAGPAQQGEELRAIYQASRINLQLIDGGFLHSRSLDGLAAGGFFLTRTSVNDGADEAGVRAQQVISRRGAELGLRTRRDLDTCADFAIKGAWDQIRHLYDSYQPDALISGIQAWRDIPPPRVLFPQLASISFNNAAEFGALADRFLANETLRRSVAAEMHEIVRKELSYSRRWQQFSAAVAKGLAAYETLKGVVA